MHTRNKLVVGVLIGLVMGLFTHIQLQPAHAQDPLVRQEVIKELNRRGLIGATFNPANAAAGPASATDTAIALFDGTTGKLLKNSLVTVNTSGQLALPNGTASAPALLGTDADTGVNFASTQVNFSVNGSNKLEVQASTIRVLTAVAGLGQQFNGMRQQVLPNTGSASLDTSSTLWTVQTNAGAGAEVTLSAPTAAAGYGYTFVVEANQFLRFDAATGDVIRGDIDRDGDIETSATSGFIRSTTVGSSLTVVSVDATTWQIVAINGTWTIDA